MNDHGNYRLKINTYTHNYICVNNYINAALGRKGHWQAQKVGSKGEEGACGLVPTVLNPEMIEDGGSTHSLKRFPIGSKLATIPQSDFVLLLKGIVPHFINRRYVYNTCI